MSIYESLHRQTNTVGRRLSVGTRIARPHLTGSFSATYCRGRRPRRPILRLLPAEGRVSRLNKVSEFTSGNEAGGSGGYVPRQGLGQSPGGVQRQHLCQSQEGSASARVQRQSLWRVKGRAFGFHQIFIKALLLYGGRYDIIMLNKIDKCRKRTDKNTARKR